MWRWSSIFYSVNLRHWPWQKRHYKNICNWALVVTQDFVGPEEFQTLRALDLMLFYHVDHIECFLTLVVVNKMLNYILYIIILYFWCHIEIVLDVFSTFLLLVDDLDVDCSRSVDKLHLERTDGTLCLRRAIVGPFRYHLHENLSLILF